MEHNLVSHDLAEGTRTIHTSLFKSIKHFISQHSLWDDFTVDCIHGFLEKLRVVSDKVSVNFSKLKKLADLVIVAFETTAILSLQGDKSFLKAIIDVLLLESRLKSEQSSRTISQVVEFSLINNTNGFMTSFIL